MENSQGQNINYTKGMAYTKKADEIATVISRLTQYCWTRVQEY